MEETGPKNTALHYAISGQWNDGIQKRLLDLGADLLAENKVGETPLSRITHITLRSFLDGYCMSSSGFHKWDNDGNLIPDEHTNIDDDFGANIADSRVSFKYTFLAPVVSEDD